MPHNSYLNDSLWVYQIESENKASKATIFCCTNENGFRKASIPSIQKYYTVYIKVD